MPQISTFCNISDKDPYYSKKCGFVQWLSGHEKMGIFVCETNKTDPSRWMCACVAVYALACEGA